MNGRGLYLLLLVASIAIVARGLPGGYFSTGGSNSYARGANISHNLIVGTRLPGDSLVLRQSVVKDSSWFRVTTYERTYNVTRPYRITQVKAIDRKGNGSGSTARLIRGGPGTDSATLRFKSQRGHGINFVVELYGRP